MKKAYFLDRTKKEYLLDNFEIITGIFKDLKKKRKKQPTDYDTKKAPEDNYVPVNYEHLSGETASDEFVSPGLRAERESLIKIAGQIHDPETVEEILKLISLMEKFILVDGDLTYDNLCVFIHPLARGSRRIILRPYKIVGLIKIIEKLSRKFKELKETPRTKTLLNRVEKDFQKYLQEIKKRLAAGEKKDSPEENPQEQTTKIRFQVNKTAQLIPEANNDRENLKKALENILRMNSSIDIETAKKQALLISGDLSYPIKNILDEVAQEVFSQK
jgi:hypothetical protein